MCEAVQQGVWEDGTGCVRLCSRVCGRMEQGVWEDGTGCVVLCVKVCERVPAVVLACTSSGTRLRMRTCLQ